MNLWGGKNREFEEAIKVARDTNPDVIALTEVTQQWWLTFTKAFPDYKYQIVEPHYGGIAILSRLPLEALEIKYFNSIKRPRIHARLMLANGSCVNLLFVHPVIPLYRNQLRDKEFILLSQEINDEKNPKILFGDFNCSPWSPVYAQLLRTTQLVDTQQGFGLQPSWGPHWCPIPIIPIDHYFISSDLSTVSRYIGPDFGSDHRPVIIELALNSELPINSMLSPLTSH
ncbi:MAG: endonuclease/exonuclease/phosphatase family protein [Candidatus Obscuribacterales bacterium]|nr:endonuclease/exonuclease/phosphatase family protein [Candidatus Obscuribacterales bacterium]